MNQEVTTVIGLDEEHLGELKISYRSWVRHRPDVENHPVMFVCDEAQGDEAYWEEMVKRFAHPMCSVRTFDGQRLREAGAGQREVMLTALVWASAQVETKYFLKIDTDTVAASRGSFVQKDWMNGDWAFVSHRWGYTKPARFIKQLDEWATGVTELASHMPPVLELPNDLDGKLYHPRIQSFIMFGSARFARRVWSMVCVDRIQRLPCPSQDTLLWYVAERMRWPYRKLNCKRLGWKHGRGALRGWSGAS